MLSVVRCTLVGIKPSIILFRDFLWITNWYLHHAREWSINVLYIDNRLWCKLNYELKEKE